jgi:hypothetical protein
MFFMGADCERESSAMKKLVRFFTPNYVFFLTLAKHKSIHSSTALIVAVLMGKSSQGRIGKWQPKQPPRRRPPRRQ